MAIPDPVDMALETLRVAIAALSDDVNAKATTAFRASSVSEIRTDAELAAAGRDIAALAAASHILRRRRKLLD